MSESRRVDVVQVSLGEGPVGLPSRGRTCSPSCAASNRGKLVIKGIDTRFTNEAADRLGQFEKPVLIGWSRDDRFFKPAHAERLAQELPNARLEWIENARSLSPEDEPARLAELIASFVRES